MKKWKDRDSESKADIIAALVVFSLVLIISTIVYFAHSKYEVEVTYCDERPPKIIQVEAMFEPDQCSIRTGSGVPEYEGEIYVCSIKTLRKISD